MGYRSPVSPLFLSAAVSPLSPSPPALSTPSVCGRRECGSTKREREREREKRKDDILTVVADLHRRVCARDDEEKPHRKDEGLEAQRRESKYNFLKKV